MARGSSLQSPGRSEEWLWFSWFIVFFHCFIMRFSCPLALSDIFRTPVARYSLFMLKVPLNPKQTNKQTNWGSLIIARGLSPQSPGRRLFMIFLVYCIFSSFYYCGFHVPWPYIIYFILLWHDIAYLCWKTV